METSGRKYSGINEGEAKKVKKKRTGAITGKGAQRFFAADVAVDARRNAERPSQGRRRRERRTPQNPLSPFIAIRAIKRGRRLVVRSTGQPPRRNLFFRNEEKKNNHHSTGKKRAKGEPERLKSKRERERKKFDALLQRRACNMLGSFVLRGILTTHFLYQFPSPPSQIHGSNNAERNIHFVLVSPLHCSVFHSCVFFILPLTS